MSLNSLKKMLLAGGSVRGQIAFTTPGAHQWTVPPNVFEVCVMCVGAGANTYQGAGSLGWGNRIAVTPGEVINIQVGRPSSGTVSSVVAARASWFRSESVLFAPGGSGQRDVMSPAPSGTARQGGGRGGANNGGAGGYTGNGGNGARSGSTTGAAGTGGGGGGGSHFVENGNIIITPGGGVGLLGEGPSGSGSPFAGGRGGSGGGNGRTGTAGTNGSGGDFGGAGGGADSNYNATAAAGGAVRIIYGQGRAFPSTNTGDV